MSTMENKRPRCRNMDLELGCESGESIYFNLSFPAALSTTFLLLYMFFSAAASNSRGVFGKLGLGFGN